MYSLKVTLSLLHPGPYKLITVTSNVLMIYYVDYSMVYKINNLNL